MQRKELRQYYAGSEFERMYTYEKNDLGVLCRDGRTCFKVWSPLAERITLCLYESGQSKKSFARHEMKKCEKGAWEWNAEENLQGIYYDYIICADGEENQTWDPYAKACGVNGTKSMVVDLTKTNPQNWEKDKSPELQNEEIIYELHVKEFSYEESSGIPLEYRGKYKAFRFEKTTLNDDGIHPTGLNYLKQLGITHIQLMPVFDYGSVDETKPEGQFNWGYDPVNYNVPEGSYASNAEDGAVRIREFKEMIQSLHKNGFRVIMDVVYNHTFSLDSCLQKTVPWYYYRQDEDGNPANGSACGNDIASERVMCGKYIKDSVLYWAKEYHIDGFRFDLMGLLNVELMNEIQKELDLQFGEGEKLLYGEPWAADTSPMENGHIPALKENIELLDEKIGMFCDSTRDAVKGHVFYEEVPGFVNGGNDLEAAILDSVTAWCEGEHEFSPKAPSQIITYISAHDNLTLWDKLVKSMPCGKEYHTRYEQVLKAYKLAAAIYFTCQGRLFMLSGEEFLRTKEGLENSYNAPIKYNRIDWEQAYENEDIVKYYRRLIDLRKQFPGIIDKSKNAVSRITNKTIEAEGCVSFLVDNTDEKGSSKWKKLFIIYNSGEERVVKLPKGKWEILLNSDSTCCREENHRIEKQIVTPSVAAVVLGQI